MLHEQAGRAGCGGPSGADFWEFYCSSVPFHHKCGRSLALPSSFVSPNPPGKTANLRARWQGGFCERLLDCACFSVGSSKEAADSPELTKITQRGRCRLGLNFGLWSLRLMCYPLHRSVLRAL